MDAVTELQQLSVAYHKANKGIGEPLVQVPSEYLFVTAERDIYITMTCLINLVRDTLAVQPKE